MNLELKVNINLNDAEGLNALSELLRIANGIGGTVTEDKPSASEPTEEPKPKRVRKATTKVEEKVEEKAEVAEPTKEPAPIEKKPTIKIETLRANLQTKVAEHRDAIKTKLTELGAGNISTLDEGHYEDFNNFLTSL